MYNFGTGDVLPRTVSVFRIWYKDGVDFHDFGILV